MNFFQAQDKARKNTSWLIFLFILAVISLIILTNILFIVTFSYMQANENVSLINILKDNYNQDITIVISLGIILLIFLGSLYKIAALSKGGPAIAEMLGGKLITQSTTDANERKLLNIVEEMSIAAGMPIPQVYLLEEPSINAFAAGQSQSNAVIGITRGSISQLTRDELQGVIAHEFSHILNGDMRLNLRLMGILHGILLIGIIGEHIVRSLRYRSSNRKEGGGAIIVIGIGLLIIGYAGTFFGKWIKASISRQREFLADASAVQFTRNKDTIAGALKKIGGLDEGSLLTTPAASEYSHAYFSDGVSHFFKSLFSTHPPLEQRIKNVDPNWDGLFILPKPIVKNTQASTSDKKTSSTKLDVTTAAIITAADQIISKVGTITEKNIDQAQSIILQIPHNIKHASQSPYSARAVIYALLIGEQKNKTKEWALLTKHADPSIPKLTKEFLSYTSKLGESLILPILELCVTSLRELSLNQYIQFKTTIELIIKEDGTVELSEWIMQRLVLQQLDLHFAIRKPAKEKLAYIGAAKKEAEVVLSLIAHIEHKDNFEKAKNAFDHAKKKIGVNSFNIIPQQELSLTTLNQSIDKLMQLKPRLKSKILQTCAEVVLMDGKATRKGAELFRTLSINLDCPVPPL